MPLNSFSLNTTSIDPKAFPPSAEYPLRADLRKDVYRPLPKIAPGTVDPAAMTGDVPLTHTQQVLHVLNAALASNDAEKVAGSFFPEQAFWRDIVAFTSHLRTFIQPDVVAAALLQLKGLRGIEGEIKISGDPHFVVMSPVMMFIDCGLSFCTTSPQLKCAGKMVLLPVKIDGDLAWKIWVLSTWIDQITQRPEDETLLSSPGRDDLVDRDVIETNVFIIGAGTSGLMTAARLKALGVESVIADRNAQVGDNWALRYDSLRFHVPTSNCEMPYSYYKKELQSPHRLTKSEVAEHLKRYAEIFRLNVMLSTKVTATTYNPAEKKWTCKLETTGGSGSKTIVSKHLVQATGIGSGVPHLPSIEDEGSYTGLSLHSSQYRNAQLLASQGIKSVAVIGSANTAFDIIQDCHDAGLDTTMVARSPTYVFPYDYVMDPHAIGAYDKMSLEAADIMLNTFPLALDGQFSHGLFAHLASLEPGRYLGLSQAGFPVLDSRNLFVDIQHHLVERGGGHYIDVGGTKLIAEGKVAVRGLVEPVAYIPTGLRLSDGSTLDADAVIWSTGFADKDVRSTAEAVLGVAEDNENTEGLLGPKEIAARLDATWGVDDEGEVRGMWKRHLRMDNYWVMGGVIQHQRWWSRPLAQQIRLALDNCLPPAYRDTPRTE